MRVIAGSARGTRLGRVPAGTRPLSDRAREGLFSSLGDRVRDARCADLFAGTGAVGIEALSREASRCAFVDSSSAAIRTIRENLARTGLMDRAEVTRAAVDRYLARPGDPLDLVILDPPYALAESSVREALEALRPRLSGGAIVALTRSSRNTTDVIPVDWSVIRRLAYGDTHVLLCREGE
jgi:16S rRNA (guanine966-N2)-methyltransferase